MSSSSSSQVNAELVDQAEQEQLLNQIIIDAGAAVAVPLALLGDRLGLFVELASGGPATPAQLADRTGLVERYVREWLLVMATAGYVIYDGNAGDDSAGSGRYRMSPAQIDIFTDPDSPAYMVGVFQSMSAATRMLDRLTEVFCTGEGIGWHEHHTDTFLGTERLFRAGYLANLTQSWIPALSGVEQRLRSGVRAADVGCGLGASTIIMAQAYPATEWVGIDFHEPSLELARSRAAEAGVDKQVSFEVGDARSLTGHYDFITYFDCLHDMPDPVGALRAARSALNEGGRVMLVEPMSWDNVTDALNPLGRLLSGGSLLICLPSGLSAPPAAGLGSQAGPSRTCALAVEAGFSGARVATSTSFNLIYELQP